jgi:DNA-binding transcriptional MerR regulator
MVQNCFLCGEIAKATGVSPDTIRHYEKIGILPKAVRSESGYRLYPQSAVERVLVVRRALRIEFTLSELADIFKTRDAGGAPCNRVFELAQDKLKAIETDIAALKKTHRYLSRVLVDWENRIQKSSRGQRAHLLQSLTDGIEVAQRAKLRRKK